MSLEGGKGYDKVVGMIVFGCGFIGVNLGDIYEWVCVILRVYDDVIEFKMVDGKKDKLEMKVNDRNEIINKVLLSKEMLLILEVMIIWRELERG